MDSFMKSELPLLQQEETSELLSTGGYAQKQFFSKEKIISWSHTRRFEMARKSVAAYKGGKLLDYGCGDGSFLMLVRDLFPNLTGADVDPKGILLCKERLGSVSGLAFVMMKSLEGSEFNGSFNVVTCMEVLEHCIPEKRAEVLRDLDRLVSNGGALLISVPIEIGPSLLIKQWVRALAGLRKIGDYQHREKYTLGEFFRMLFAKESSVIKRPIYETINIDKEINRYHGHKGFNWKELRSIVSDQFLLEKTWFSPLGWSRGWLSSQAWFLCRKKVKI